jgi:hypothetical protein
MLDDLRKLSMPESAVQQQMRMNFFFGERGVDVALIKAASTDAFRPRPARP